MGVKFGAADSSNLISAMRNNLTNANTIIDRLGAGAQHLMAHLDSGTLQGAAYTAGRGLFSDLIIPGITKLGQAVDDVMVELASYEYAHSVVAEYGDLDQDDLEQALRDAEDQLSLVEAQIEVNKVLLAQVSGLPGSPSFGADRLDQLSNNQELEQLREELEHEIQELRTKLAKLEWFVSDVSNYFSDSLRVMQLAAQSAVELSKVAVEADGSYYMAGVNLEVFRKLRDAKLTTYSPPPNKIPRDSVSFDDLRHASDLSYDKLAGWLSSDEAKRLHSLARANPGLFNSMLSHGLMLKAEKNGWGLLGGLIDVMSSNSWMALQGGLVFLEKFPTGAEWDMKPYLAEEYEYDAGYYYLYDDQGRTVRSDVFGNVQFGSMLAHWGVDFETALRGANMGESAGVNAGVNDELDDRAVEFGYRLYKKYPNGLSREQFYEELANANLFK